MKLQLNTALDYFLTDLFDRYRQVVPEVERITKALSMVEVISSQGDIENDHIAFRTLGIPHLGVASFEKIFLHHGYTKMDHYHFEDKKLNAWWYAPPNPNYPRVFLSELIVEALSDNAGEIIRRYTRGIDSDPVDQINLDHGEEIAQFLHTPLWPLPTVEDYQTLLEESEYAAWVIYNRYYLNHYTISVHSLKPCFNNLEDFNDFVESLDIKLNDAGGKIKTSSDGLLRQSSTIAGMHEGVFANGEYAKVSGSYVEFAERSVLPQYRDLPEGEILRHHRRDGFETANADKIFESTYTKQTGANK